MSIVKVNIKESLLSNEVILRSQENSFGFELVLNHRLTRKLRFETGLEYFSNQFITIGSYVKINKSALDVNSQFKQVLIYENVLGTYSSEFVFEWNDSDCTQQYSEDQEIVLAVNNQTNLYTLGLPLRIEYLFGERKLQFFINAGISPSIYLKRKPDFSKNYIGPNLYPKHCIPRGDEQNVADLIDITQIISNEVIINYNVNKFFISTMVSAGLKYQWKRSVFKLGIAYGGNTINFSKFNNKNHIKEIVQLKCGLHMLMSK